jgi:hypothetical protein
VLQAAVEWGLPAALILGGLVILLAAGMRQRTSPFGVAVSCSLLASLTLALVDGNLVMPITQTAFALGIGLHLGLSRSSPSRGNDRPVLASALAASALAASICLAIYAVSSFSAHETARDDFLRANPGVWLLPRFWEHSLF